jgi:glycosyltransferase involved in cell wall biosynthesis
MDNKKNILFLGTTNYGFELSNSDKNKFKELNSMLNVFVFTYGKLAREIDFENVKIKYLKEPKQLLTKYLKFYFFSIFTLMNFINVNNISIVSAKEPISALNPVLIKLIFKKDIKIIIENHGDYRIQLLQQRDSYIFSKTIFLTKYINKFVFNHADMLRGVSKQNSKAFKIYNPNLRNYNFPAWIDNSIFKYTNVERSNDILFVGNIIKRKGIEF